MTKLFFLSMTTFHHRKKSSAGFTLAEMAIVVLLIGIMLSMGVGLLSAQTENAAISVTKQREEAIKNAMVTYLRANWRLPCPDRTFAAPNGSGDDDRTTPGNVLTPCAGGAAAGFGLVPYLELGLPRDMAMDGWGNFFSYHVSVAPTNWALTAGFNTAATGAITVNSRAPGPAVITTAAVAVIVSHGKNGTGSYTIKGARNALPAGTFVDELENTNGDTTYFKREYTATTTAPGGAFDDIVTVVLANDLLTPLRSDGSIKTEEERLDTAQSTIITAAIPACTLPAAIPTPMQAYGSVIVYTRIYATPITTAVPVAGTAAFSLTAGGTTRAISIDPVRAVFIKYGVCP